MPVFAAMACLALLTSDNGSVFWSAAFNEFLDSIGTKHAYSSNYHSCSNGTVERLHGTLKSRLKRVFYERKLPLQAALDSVLYDIRSMPHGVTGDTSRSSYSLAVICVQSFLLCGLVLRQPLALGEMSMPNMLSYSRL